MITWTSEKLGQIPEVYRDLLLALKPVVDSEAPHAVLRITGIPIGHFYRSAQAHGYDLNGVRALIEELQGQGYVSKPDAMGFYVPTAKGKKLIRALSGPGAVPAQSIPHMPGVED